MFSFNGTPVSEEVLMSTIERAVNNIIERKLGEQSTSVQHQTKYDVRHNPNCDWWECRVWWACNCITSMVTERDSYSFQANQNDRYISRSKCDYDDYFSDQHNHIETKSFRKSQNKTSDDFISCSNRDSKFPFKFSGLNIVENPNTNKVESFLHKIHVYMKREFVLQHEMLSEIPTFLYGPATNWFTIAKNHIRSWDIFVHEFRNRFSRSVEIDDVIIDLKILFSESITIKSKSPNISCASDPKVSLDNQQSLPASVMKNLPTNFQDDSLIHINETPTITRDIPFRVNWYRSCLNLLKIPKEFEFKLYHIIRDRMIESKLTHTTEWYDIHRPHGDGIKILFWNFKKRKK